MNRIKNSTFTAGLLLLGIASANAAPPQLRESDEAAARLGWSAASAGDVNNDGYSDVVVGAPGHSNGQAQEGIVSVYLGGSSGMASSPTWTYESNQAGAALGASVAGGNVNNDSYSDVIVGVPGWDGTSGDEGRILVFLGSSSGLPSSPSWSYVGQAGSRLGTSVASARSVNNDLYADVIAGAPLHDGSLTNEGRVVVFHGSSTGLPSSPSWSALGGQAGAELGGSVAAAGDTDGDGYADLIAGAMAWDGTSKPDCGRALAWAGSSTGLASSAMWTYDGGTSYEYLGEGVGTAGDVNNDGKHDVVVSSGHRMNGEDSQGRILVFHGSNQGPKNTPATTLVSSQSDSGFGWAASTAGKFNADNYWDLAVGQPLHDGSLQDEGRVAVYYGSNAGLSTTPAWTYLGGGLEAQLGQSVALAGDVNADGRSDLLVGAPGRSNGQTREGGVYLFLSAP